MVIPVTHVIFDFDGVLVNAVDVINDVLREYAISQGKQLTIEVETLSANITNLSVFFNTFFDSIDLKEESINRNELITELVRIFFTKKFQLIPGVEKLVRHLHKHNIPMAIATGNSNRHYNIVTKQFGDFFDTHFSHAVKAWDDEEVVNKKPNPDVYFVCAKRFQSQPKDLQNILVIEDSFTGITGAVATGMKTLLINDRKLDQFTDISDKITVIADTFDDFKPESVGLPAYES